MSDHRNNAQGGGPGLPGGPSRSNAITTLLVIGIIVYLVYSMGSSFAGRGQTTDVLPTNEFVTAVEQGRVYDVNYKTSDGSVTGSYWKSAADKGDEGKLVPYQSGLRGIGLARQPHGRALERDL